MNSRRLHKDFVFVNRKNIILTAIIQNAISSAWLFINTNLWLDERINYIQDKRLLVKFDLKEFLTFCKAILNILSWIYNTIHIHNILHIIAIPYQFTNYSQVIVAL